MRGDQIYVMRPLLGLDSVYEHHGIDCGDGTVIHYSKAAGEPTVRRTSMAAFAQGNPVYLKRQPVSFVPDVVLERAESRLGEQQYDLMTNNCEHFANWCKIGRNESEQLTNYGLGTGGISLPTSRRMIETATQDGDPVKALVQFQQALQNVAIARSQFQTQYIQAETQANQWQQVAELALKQGKEPVARAALERKVAAKRQASDYQTQIDQLKQLEADLQRNGAALQERNALVVQ